MSVQHKNLTASQLHESKGVSAASDGDFNIVNSSANVWTTLHGESAQTASVDANLNFTNLSEYRTLILTFDDLLLSDTELLGLRFSSDNGSSYLSTSIHYAAANQNGTSVPIQAYTALYLSNSTSADYVSGKITLTNFNKTLVTGMQGIVCRNSNNSMSGTRNTALVTGIVNSATAFDALRIFPAAGTLTSGVVTLEGTRS